MGRIAGTATAHHFTVSMRKYVAPNTVVLILYFGPSCRSEGCDVFTWSDLDTTFDAVVFSEDPERRVWSCCCGSWNRDR